MDIIPDMMAIVEDDWMRFLVNYLQLQLPRDPLNMMV